MIFATLRLGQVAPDIPKPIDFSLEPEIPIAVADDDVVDFAPKKRVKRELLSGDPVVNGRLWSMKLRAEKKGLGFDLDEHWLIEKLSKEFCEVTGIRFDGLTLKSPFTRTIDRTDNNEGYLKSNCKVVVWIYNQAKKDHGAEHVLAMARALVSQN